MIFTHYHSGRTEEIMRIADATEPVEEVGLHVCVFQTLVILHSRVEAIEWQSLSLL